jgi:hypothetical protein
MPLTAAVCQTNPDSGQCLAPASSTVTTTIANNQNTTWTAFWTASGTIHPDARKIRAAMKGIRRTYAAPQAQAEAFKPALVRGILATLGDSP